MVVVATKGGPEADHAVHLPLAVSCLPVQWSARVPLGKASVLSGGAFELGWGDGRGGEGATLQSPVFYMLAVHLYCSAVGCRILGGQALRSQLKTAP